jgi:PAS domain S-box-containing protein
MFEWFHRLRVSQKLMLISVLFMIPDSVLLCLFLFSINDNIRFARWEQMGIEYQRPLERLLVAVPQHQFVTRGGAQAEGVVAIELQIDEAFRQLAAVDADLGERLQFTEEGLAKRHRSHCRPSVLRREWEELKGAWRGLSPEVSSARHRHLVSDLRTVITHVGDNSNLILDPDLDSYYLMDVVLLALPEMQDRLSEVLDYAADHWVEGALPQETRRHLAVCAALLRESDLDRVTTSARTALNEDPNFYGSSPSLARRLPPALERFTTEAGRVIDLMEHASETGDAGTDPAGFAAAESQARQASFELWQTASEELDALLVTRADAYRGRRARSLLLTALALGAAVSFVTFITRSISQPLQRQAAALRHSNAALQSEVAERERVEVALRAAEAKYRSIFENAVEGIFQTTPDGRYLSANPALARMYGCSTPEELQQTMTDIGSSLYLDPGRRSEFQRVVESEGEIHRFESRIRRKDGTVIWISESARAVRDTEGRIVYYEGTVEDITDRKRREAELEAAHRELLKASRLAGMAEVATGVLHNVGNVLNSVSVAAQFVSDRLRQSRVPDLAKAVALLQDQGPGLAAFLQTDPRGCRVPGFLQQITDHLTSENLTLRQQMDQQRTHLDHIRHIVSMQQTHARVSCVAETVPVVELIEDALRLNSGALTRHQIEVCRQFHAQHTVTVDKHKALQILVNLIANAKRACTEAERTDRRITLRTRAEGGLLRIDVVDNGVGIPPENLVRIFQHGFTTRPDGHGFGLHSGALAARELGGALRVHSDGAGHGAIFTLELPLPSEEARAA